MVPNLLLICPEHVVLISPRIVHVHMQTAHKIILSIGLTNYVALIAACKYNFPTYLPDVIKKDRNVMLWLQAVWSQWVASINSKGKDYPVVVASTTTG